MKTILITGAGRGIGRATAILAGQRGWSVVINYVADRAAADRTAADVRDAGGCALVLPANVGMEAEVVAMFDQACAELGTLDGVVVNAGVLGSPMPLADMTAERLRATFDTNILGAFLCAREASRRLARSRGGPGGSIVLVSSVAARLGGAGRFVDYAGSKAALDALTLGLSKELGGEGVRVNAVRPGVIDTDIHANGHEPLASRNLAADVPMARAGTPEEVAEAIIWLLSEAASYTTGAIIDVAGGR